MHQPLPPPPPHLWGLGSVTSVGAASRCPLAWYSVEGGYIIFDDEGEFYSLLDDFLSSEEGARYNGSVVVQMGDDGVTNITASAIQAEYSGVINGEASKQVMSPLPFLHPLIPWYLGTGSRAQSHMRRGSMEVGDFAKTVSSTGMRWI